MCIRDSIYIPASQVPESVINSYSYSSVPKCYTYMDQGGLNASGINRLHEHPYLRLRGAGTLIAIIDSGIDYTHSAFRNGNQSRIVSIWDQSLPSGESEEVPYGQVFTRQEINRALQSENPQEIVPSADINGHGTRLASIAAGNRNLEEGVSGAAPEAELVIVKLKPAKEYLREPVSYTHLDVYKRQDYSKTLTEKIIEGLRDLNFLDVKFRIDFQRKQEFTDNGYDSIEMCIRDRHQAYTHKILTGRKDGFAKLRQEGGMSGFPKRKESDCDAFDAGHSSNSISAGLGYVRARDLLGQNYRVVSVIGDGALTGGMAYEAMNNAAGLKTNFIIVLNDNNMSISKNVGGMSSYLSALRTAESYTDVYKRQDLPY